MKKYIVAKTKELIEAKSMVWALNYIVVKNLENSAKPEDVKQVNSARLQMTTIEGELDFLKKLLKSETK